MTLTLTRAPRATVAPQSQLHSQLRTRPGSRPLPEPPRPGRTVLLPWALAAVLFAAYTALSVSRHLHLRTSGFDLGIFEQAVRGYAEGRAPVSELKGPGFHLLGDHFHPILATLAPLYRVFPSPMTLLVAQAALLAVSAVPVTRVAARAAGPWAGAGIGVGYGLSVGLQQAVAFDFHEIAFAVPLLAFSLERLTLRRWRAAAWCALPLLLVKEDLAATVVAVGCYLFWHGRRRLGAGVVALAAATVALVVLVVIPALNPDGVYTYLSNVDGPAGDPVTRLLLPAQKWGTVAVLLAPTAFLALRSPLILLALPTLGWRFWSTNPAYWGTGFHYGAVLMPIVFLAFADALARLRARHGLRRWTACGLVAVGLAVTAAALPFRPLAELARPATWQRDATADAVRGVLRVIPDGAQVAAANGIAPQLTDRTRVFLFPYYPGGPGAKPDWVAAPDHPRDGLFPAGQEAEALRALPAAGYRPVASAGGVTVYHLGARE
ncbi:MULTISPECIES: DUF2079 domain-containing protein [unclassified Kitasatospora]|uniref:DUF2079 domain-containing protein n=1 Tax=unclassified Kitasatospora TaxID=2633591 RepID=UPI00381C84CC